MINKEKTMKHKLVHETINIKGWDMVGNVIWKIGEKTELPFDDHKPNKTLHYINGYDKVCTRFMCIGEIVDLSLIHI